MSAPPPALRELIPGGALVHGAAPTGAMPRGGPVRLAVHEQLSGWTLMATLELDGDACAVFEQLGREHGRLCWVTPQGVALELATTLEPTRVEESSCYLGRDKLEMLAAPSDVWSATLLDGTGDPDPASVARALPPIRRARPHGEEIPHSFLGTPQCADVIPLFYDPRAATPRVNPVAVLADIEPAIVAEELSEGLVGGYLPVARMRWPLAPDGWLEQVAFADPETPEDGQRCWYRFVHWRGETLHRVRYIDTYLPYPHSAEADPAAFYGALARVAGFWRARVEEAPGMRVELPEPWIADFCKHAFVLEMITRTGDRPHYGVVDRAYGGAEHDGFQDIFTSAVIAYCEWGRDDVARRYVDQYFDRFVAPNGSLDYRGPEIGQYGRMLAVVARLAVVSGDDSVVLKHRTKLLAIAEILLTRHDEAKRLPLDDPAFGMIRGRHEADISFTTATLGRLDYEQPYFSNSTEAWRGLRDLGRVVARLEGRDSDVAKRLLGAADELAEAIPKAIERSWIERGGLRRLPLIAGSPRLHREAPYRSCPESFDENRVFSEMFASGLLSRDIVRALVDAGARDGDARFGILGNRKHLVAFTAAGTAHGLIQHDLIREFLLLLWAHLFHLHTRGTWTAFECVDPDRDRAEHLPYCVAAQTTIPTLVRWMLVYEDPLDGAIWIAKAAPRSWLAHGQHLAVRGAPTAAGPLDYAIDSAIDHGVVSVRVTLPPRVDQRVVLRLRAPEHHRLAQVEIDGCRWNAIDLEREAIELPREGGRTLDITASYE